MLMSSKNNKGFTLIEVLLSMAVLVIMITSIFYVFTNANGMALKSHNYNEASNNATSQFANGFATSTNTKKVEINNSPAASTDQAIFYDDRLMTATTYNEGIYVSISSESGSTVRYFYYVPYHPYRCGAECKQCNRENFEAPTT